MKKKILLLSLCGLLIVSGCGGHKVELKNGKEIVASIKGKKITAEDLFEDLKKSYGTQTVVNTIDEYIANKEVKTTDTMKSNAKKQISEMKEYYESMDQSWSDVLAQYGYDSDDDLINDYVLNAKKEEVVKNFLKKSVTDEEINAYYDEEIYGNYTAKHILITPDVEDDASDDDKKKAEEKALEKAKEVISKLQNGEKWKDLVAEYSEDEASKEDEGLISDFTKGDVVDEFFNATLELKDNEYTKEPVKSSYGYHIILKVKSTDKPKLKEVKDKVISSIVDNKLTNDANLYSNTWVEIRKSYELKINDSTIEKNYNK